jgi:hypothetical protein
MHSRSIEFRPLYIIHPHVKFIFHHGYVVHHHYINRLIFDVFSLKSEHTQYFDDQSLGLPLEVLIKLPDFAQI